MAKTSMGVLANVLLADGTNVNHTLVKDGWCWWYRKYAPNDTPLEKLETEAIAAERGLWVNPESGCHRGGVSRGSARAKAMNALARGSSVKPLPFLKPAETILTLTARNRMAAVACPGYATRLALSSGIIGLVFSP